MHLMHYVGNYRKGMDRKPLNRKKKQPEEDTHLFYKDFEGESM